MELKTIKIIMAEWKKFHDSCTELHNHITFLENKITNLESILNGFMSEEDVMSLPSYKLFLMQYTPNNTTRIKTSTPASLGAFDPMYAPPNARRKPTINVKTSKSPPMPVQVSIPMPVPMPIPAPMPKLEIIDIKTAPDDIIYPVELEGKIYHFYNSYLYDCDSHLRIGKLTNTDFNVHNSSVPLGPCITLTTMENYTEYFMNSDNKVYIKVQDAVVQNVGQYIDGEIQVWA
jgi:hypothetical protein